MAFRWKNTLKDRDVTDEEIFLNRRQLMAGVSAGIGLSVLAEKGAAAEELSPSDWEDITQYNNFYEFGTGKSDPFQYANALTTSPWTVTIDGLVDRPADYAFEDIIKQMTVEERIYRFRCVEAWSMIVPWVCCFTPGGPPWAPSATGATFTCARISTRPIFPWSRWTGPGRSLALNCWRKNASILTQKKRNNDKKNKNNNNNIFTKSKRKFYSSNARYDICKDILF